MTTVNTQRKMLYNAGRYATAAMLNNFIIQRIKNRVNIPESELQEYDKITQKQEDVLTEILFN